MRSKETLASLPSLVAEIHPDDPVHACVDMIGVGSARRVRWVCAQGHDWETQVRARAQQGTGCPYCAHKAVWVGFNDLTTTHPHLASEWDTKRNAMSPDQVHAGTPKKAWWSGNCGHAWEAGIRYRASGTGCPYCDGKAVDSTNDVVSAWPEALDWWVDTSVAPSDLHHGSSRHVSFRCPEGHEFTDKVKSVVARTERRCPACKGTGLRPGLNDLATLRPDLAAEWVDSTPASAVTLYEAEQRQWLCSQGHAYKMKVRSRVGGVGCPACSGRVVTPGINDLSTTHPDLIEQWDFERNVGLDPTLLGRGSNQRPWWRCAEGHSWQVSVSDRTNHSTGCPFCAGSRTDTGVNDLATTHPEIAAQWHPARNGDLSPSDVTPGSGREAWWVASCGHEWNSTVRARVRLYETAPCAVCAGVFVQPGINDVTTTHPKIRTVIPEPDLPGLRTVPPGSARLVQWECPHGHTGRNQVRHLVRMIESDLDPCSVCGGRKVESGVNDAATLYPHLVPEVDPSSSDPGVLSGLTPGSGRRIDWRCASGHQWDTRLVDRIHHNTGCPECAAAAWTSRGEEEVAEYLEGLGLSVTRARRVDSGKRRFNYDIAVPDLRLLVEYNGTFFHSESTGRDHRYHADKHRAAIEVGWSLLAVWEDDWILRRNAVEEMLAHKVGKSTLPRVAARSCRVAEVANEEASRFLESHHVQGTGTGSVRLGLRNRDDGRLVALLVARIDDGTAEIVRYATAAIVPGGFGKLLAALETEIVEAHPRVGKIKTFSDNLVSDGTLYERLGFAHDGDVPPTYTYARGRGPREHKFNYRIERFRRDETLRFQEGLSERELADLNNLHRIWDAGKRRWVKPVSR